MTPFHCPYCAEENLWPHEPEGWECRSCRRAFKVTFLGQLGVSTSSTSGGDAEVTA
jgi:hypothetical protein